MAFEEAFFAVAAPPFSKKIVLTEFDWLPLQLFRELLALAPQLELLLRPDLLYPHDAGYFDSSLQVLRTRRLLTLPKHL